MIINPYLWKIQSLPSTRMISRGLPSLPLAYYEIPRMSALTTFEASARIRNINLQNWDSPYSAQLNSAISDRTVSPKRYHLHCASTREAVQRKVTCITFATPYLITARNSRKSKKFRIYWAWRVSWYALNLNSTPHDKRNPNLKFHTSAKNVIADTLTL